MSKKLFQYKGFIFLESLIAVTLTCFIIGSYFSMMTFLLKSKQEKFTELMLRRILYEEVRQYEQSGGSLHRRRLVGGQEFLITFSMQALDLVKIEITNGKRSFAIER